MATYDYRGWRIQTQQTSQWHSIMWPPGSGLADRRNAFATIEEGEDVCLSRAKAMIDETEWLGGT